MREERRRTAITKFSTRKDSDIKVGEDVVDVRTGGGLGNHMHVKGVGIGESLEAYMVLVWDNWIFRVYPGPVLFHVILTLLGLCGVSLATTGVAADWLSVLIRIWRGCSRVRVAVECDVVSLLEGVHKPELALKWTDIEAHRIELDVVGESMLSKLAVCATRGKVLAARGERTRESEDSIRANGMGNSGEVRSLLVTNVEEV